MIAQILQRPPGRTGGFTWLHRARMWRQCCGSQRRSSALRMRTRENWHIMPVRQIDVRAAKNRREAVSIIGNIAPCVLDQLGQQVGLILAKLKRWQPLGMLEHGAKLEHRLLDWFSHS